MTNEQLDQFKKSLIEEREEILEDLNISSENISNLRSGNKSGDLVDQAYNQYEKELLIGLSSGDKETLKKIDKALQKIKDGSFGSCEKCGASIEEKRLEAIPYAIRCIECKKKEVKESKALKR